MKQRFKWIEKILYTAIEKSSIRSRLPIQILDLRFKHINEGRLSIKE